MSDETQQTQLAALQHTLDDLRAERDAIEEQIERYRTAIQALNGDLVRLGGRRSVTAGKAILAALGTFKSPVRTEDLLDHDSLGHYSRHTLRGVLTELRRSGRITGTRGPKGFIWDPPDAKS